MADPVGPMLERRAEERVVDKAGFYMPRWAIVAIGLFCSFTTALVATTWSAAQKVARAEERVNTMDVRLCRIEAALKITPWPTCPRQ